jgi:hypothetical protein
MMKITSPVNEELRLLVKKIKNWIYGKNKVEPRIQM